MTTLHSNPERLEKFLTEIATFGATSNNGVTRLALSDEDKAARDRLAVWFREAGCEMEVDRMGNMFFIRPGKNRALPPVLTGSHCDSQPLGGRFDGILGIIAGLEVMCALNDAGIQLERDFIVVNWTNEEGSRFTPGTTGSGVFTGGLDREEMYALTDREGHTFGEELKRIGYMGKKDFSSMPLHANFECHIEQGPVLEKLGKPIGVPKGIVCLRWYDVEIQGVPNHVGPTPMDDRKDALYAFARMNQAIFETGLAAGNVVASVGEVHATPNSRNVIPGHVKFTIDIRGWDEPKTDRVCADIEKAITSISAEMGIESEIRCVWKVKRAPFSPELVSMIHEISEELGLPAHDMVSGASHDTVYINQIAPSAMIFVPSIGGRSHAEVEETSWADCAAGTDVLLNCVLKSANAPEGTSYSLGN